MKGGGARGRVRQGQDSLSILAAISSLRNVREVSVCGVGAGVCMGTWEEEAGSVQPLKVTGWGAETGQEEDLVRPWRRRLEWRAAVQPGPLAALAV